MFASKQHTFCSNPVRETALTFTQAKVGIGLVQGVVLVILLKNLSRVIGVFISIASFLYEWANMAFSGLKYLENLQ